MKFKLLIPIYGDILENKYLNSGVFPYHSFSEMSLYRTIRVAITVLIVGFIVL